METDGRPLYDQYGILRLIARLLYLGEVLAIVSKGENTRERHGLTSEILRLTCRHVECSCYIKKRDFGK